MGEFQEKISLCSAMILLGQEKPVIDVKTRSLPFLSLQYIDEYLRSYKLSHSKTY